MNFSLCFENKPSTEEADACKDAYASVRRYRDMIAHVDASDHIFRRVDI